MCGLWVVGLVLYQVSCTRSISYHMNTDHLTDVIKSYQVRTQRQQPITSINTRIGGPTKINFASSILNECTYSWPRDFFWRKKLISGKRESVSYSNIR